MSFVMSTIRSHKRRKTTVVSLSLVDDDFFGDTYQLDEAGDKREATVNPATHPSELLLPISIAAVPMTPKVRLDGKLICRGGGCSGGCCWWEFLLHVAQRDLKLGTTPACAASVCVDSNGRVVGAVEFASNEDTVVLCVTAACIEAF